MLLLGSTWGGSALGMLVSILVGRALGPEALGSIGFSTGIVGLVMAILLPGFAQAHLKRLAEGQDPERCLGTMLAIQLALHAVLVAALAALWSVQGLFAASGLAQVFLLLLGAQVATNFADIFLKVFIAREWVVPHYAHRAVRAPPAAPGHRRRPGHRTQRGRCRRHLRPRGRGHCGLAAATVLGLRYRLAPRAPTRESLAGYWRFARPFLVTTPLALFQDSIDRVMVATGRASPRPATTRSRARCGRRSPR